MDRKIIDIKDIILGSSHWNKNEIEITIVFYGLVIKNNYIPYIQELHDDLFEKEASLEKKLSVLKDDIQKILSNLKEDQYVEPSKLFFR